MALVVLLRGVNVGGHRTFRPSVLAKELKLDVVSIGAAGTFVVRRPVSRSQLSAEIIRRLPFEAEVMICEGNEILRLVAADPFNGQPSGPILKIARALEAGYNRTGGRATATDTIEKRKTRNGKRMKRGNFFRTGA